MYKLGISISNAFSVTISQSLYRTLLLTSYKQIIAFFSFQPTQDLTTKTKGLLETVKAQEHVSVSEGIYQQPD